MTWVTIKRVCRCPYAHIAFKKDLKAEETCTQANPETVFDLLNVFIDICDVFYACIILSLNVEWVSL